MNHPTQFMQKGDGLIVVDVQWDFCPGGHLPVPDGHQVLPAINEWIRLALERGMPVYASRDWHPRGHISFKERGGLWPPHCIQDTSGSLFHPELIHDERIVVVTKGTRFDRDQNSAFDETGLQRQLEYDGVRRLFVGGLALDVCVLATVIDAVRNGFDTYLIKDATRPVDEEKGRRAVEQMIKQGVTVL